MLPMADELDNVIQNFPTGNIPLYRGYSYLPEFKKYIFETFGSKIVVTAAIQCSDILMAQYAKNFKLDKEKYQKFKEEVEVKK